MKMLDAVCENNVVTSEGVTVAAEILSEGVGSSEGVVLLDGPKAKYLTSNATDIKDSIEKMSEILQQLVTILSGLDGVTNSPGAQAGAISSLSALNDEFEALKDTLK